jgi:arginyl-tRNA synthetase
MIVSKIREVADLTISNMYGALAEGCSYQINQTKPEFEGDYTIVLFSLVKPLKKSPDTLGQELGMALIESNPT